MIRRILATLLVAGALIQAQGARYALLVGNSSGGSGLVKLKYVGNDIVSLRSILSGFCGFGEGNIVALRDNTPAGLRTTLDSLAVKLASDEGNLFLFYYTGHADDKDLKMGDSTFPLAELKDRFAALPSRVRIGIFDACQSGSFTRLKGGQLAEPFLFKDDSRIQGQVILSSSSATENAQESDHYGNSVFTFHFVNALRGSGDLSGDGKVTLSEAYQYSYNHTVSSTARSWGGVQHPGYQFRIQGEGDIVLADLNLRSMGIVLGPDIAGQVTILDKRQNIVADLNKDLGSRTLIALNPGLYQVFTTASGMKYRGEVTVSASQVMLSMRGLKRIAAHASLPKGSDGSGPQPERPGFQIGVTAAGGYRLLDLDATARQISERFSGFGYFGMQPAFGFRRGLPLIAAGPALSFGQFTGHATLGWATAAHARSFTGDRVDGIDGKTYGYRLAVRDSLRLTVVDVGATHRLGLRALEGVLLRGGVETFAARFSSESWFDDTHFDVQVTSSQSESGSAFVPYLGIGYSRMLPFCEVGAVGCYRYGSRNLVMEQATSAGTGSPLTMAVSGFEGALFVTFRRTKGSAE